MQLHLDTCSLQQDFQCRNSSQEEVSLVKIDTMIINIEIVSRDPCRIKCLWVSTKKQWVALICYFFVQNCEVMSPGWVAGISEWVVS